jgi:hypothetical protein|tara:strand:+ start:276 stop:503 length:228 start_codon:yes stop_codon:yes gene_type:complete
MPENKDKIAQMRAQIAKLQEHLKGAKGDFKKELLAKISSLEAEIKKITDVGNGDGTGRKPIPSPPVMKTLKKMNE